MTTRAKRLAVAALLLAAVGGGLFVWLSSSKPAWYQRLQYPLEYKQLVVGNARTFGLDPALVAAVIYTESRFHADAVSNAGAIGLMQLLPETGKWIAATTGGTRFRVKDLYDPAINVRFGTYYLKSLLHKYRGNARIALAAYHAGQTNADRWLAHGGAIGFPDTREYVANVLGARLAYRRAYEALRT